MPRSKKRRGTRNKINSTHSIYDFSKFTVWTLRICNTGKFHDHDLRDAAPCTNCCKSLYKLGFTKLGFTTEDGEFVIEDLRYYCNDHISHAQKNSEKYCKNNLIK